MSGTALAAVTRSEVTAALDTVRDPELDEPVTSLGFVSSCEISGDGVVEVHLRLPTYFCAPNFAFLMVADAHDAVSSVRGVARAVIVLDDHFASDAINRGVASRDGFAATFGDQADGELTSLRRDFVRKAVLAGTDRVCRPLVRAGASPQDLARSTLGEVEPSHDLDLLRVRRREIGLPSDDSAPLLIDVETGAAVREDDLRLHLGRARLSRVNIEANGSICRGMLASRYGTGGTDAASIEED